MEAEQENPIPKIEGNSEKKKEICWDGVPWSEFVRENREYFDRILYDSEGNWVFTSSNSPRYYEFGKLKMYCGTATEPFEKRDEYKYELIEDDARWKELCNLWDELRKNNTDVIWELEERRMPFKGFLGEGEGRFIKRRGNYKLIPIEEWGRLVENYEERKVRQYEDTDSPEERYGRWTDLPDWDELKKNSLGVSKLTLKEKRQRWRERNQQADLAQSDWINISQEIKKRKEKLKETFQKKSAHIASLDPETVSAQEISSLKELKRELEDGKRESIRLDEYDHSRLVLDEKEGLRSNIASANEEIARERDILLSELEDFFMKLELQEKSQKGVVAVASEPMPEWKQKKLDRARISASEVLYYYERGLEAADGIYTFYCGLYGQGTPEKFEEKIEELKRDVEAIENTGSGWTMPERVSLVYRELESLDSGEAAVFSQEARAACLKLSRLHVQQAERVLAEKRIESVINPDKVVNVETPDQRERRLKKQLESKTTALQTALHANVASGISPKDEGYRKKETVLQDIGAAANTTEARTRIGEAFKSNILTEDEARGMLSAIEMEGDRINEFISQNKPEQESKPENMDEEVQGEINGFIIALLNRCSETESWQKHMDLGDKIDLLGIESEIFLAEILHVLEESMPEAKQEEYLSKKPFEIINTAFESHKETKELRTLYGEYLKNMGKDRPKKKEEADSKAVIEEWDDIFRKSFSEFKEGLINDVERTQTWRLYMNDRSRKRFISLELKIFMRQLAEDTGMEIHPVVREKYIRELLKT